MLVTSRTVLAVAAAVLLVTAVFARRDSLAALAALSSVLMVVLARS